MTFRPKSHILVVESKTDYSFVRDGVLVFYKEVVCLPVCAYLSGTNFICTLCEFNEDIPMAAFTVPYNKETNALIVQARIFENGKSYETWGLIDTGSTKTAISQTVVDKLQLTVCGTNVTNTASGSDQVPCYMVSLIIQDAINVVCFEVELFEKYENGPDFLIGMDVISQGNLAITNYNGIKQISFEYPASGAIDFTNMQITEV